MCKRYQVFFPAVLMVFFSLSLSGFAETVPSPPTSLEEFRSRMEAVTPGRDNKPIKAERYWTVSECRRCHDKLFQQYNGSMHARSFENPVFQALYFRDVVPRALNDAGINDEARTCIACHAPVASIKKKMLITERTDVPEEMSGVTCDFCHTIKSYSGKSPGNANYVSVPGQQKLGPYIYKSNWHHQYSELQTKSIFCAICHQRTNRKGLEIISTFKEWKESAYADMGIQCQDCHMNVNGFLTACMPEYESGKAADMLAGITPVITQQREKLYTHRFPGAHSKSQVAGALKVGIEVGEEVIPGGTATVRVSIDNSKSGHKMPTGSAELRLLWVELKAVYGGVAIPVALADEADDKDIRKYNNKVMGNDIPEGSRIYRAILLDENGGQTFNSYDAVKVLYDNRLNASEVREERYRIKIPQGASGSIDISTTLYYLSYPDSFARRLDIAEAEVIKIASEYVMLSIKELN